MRKIPTLYVRDQSTHYVTDQVTPGCEWVLAGEGVPTRKLDGVCVMFDGTDWWARREVKFLKPVPPGFKPVEYDDVTGNCVGWEPIEQSPFVKFWREAYVSRNDREPGTYELCGPKINGNPEKFDGHALVEHDPELLAFHTVSNDPQHLIAMCRQYDWEGVVWHHPDGRRAKLKVRDYPKDPS